MQQLGALHRGLHGSIWFLATKKRPGSRVGPGAHYISVMQVGPCSVAGTLSVCQCSYNLIRSRWTHYQLRSCDVLSSSAPQQENTLLEADKDCWLCSKKKKWHVVPFDCSCSLIGRASCCHLCWCSLCSDTLGSTTFWIWSNYPQGVFLCVRLFFLQRGFDCIRVPLDSSLFDLKMNVSTSGRGSFSTGPHHLCSERLWFCPPGTSCVFWRSTLSARVMKKGLQEQTFRPLNPPVPRGITRFHPCW